MDTYEYLDIAWQVNEAPDIVPPALRSIADQSLARLRNWLKDNHVDPHDESTFKTMCLGSFFLLEFLDYTEEITMSGDEVAMHMVHIIKSMCKEMTE